MKARTALRMAPRSRGGTARSGVLGIASCAAALVLAAPPTAAGHSGELIGEYATATVDGVITAGEYEGSCTEKIYQSSSQNN